MYNFVLPGKEKLPGNNRTNQFYVNAGKEPYPEWEEEFEIIDGEEERVLSFQLSVNYAMNK